MSKYETQTARHDTSYGDWSNHELIKRISDLESQLRVSNNKLAHTLSSKLSPAPPKKKPKKAPKAFDPSKYSTRLIALKFAYLGGRYNGFESHANNRTPLPTIEDELWKAFKTTKLIFPTPRDGAREEEVCWDGCDYSKCGRTDRGVSAFGQVIGLRVRSSRPKEQISGERQVDEGASEVRVKDDADGDSPMPDDAVSDEEHEKTSRPVWDPIKDELPYIQLLNRVLPSDIRILAWNPNPPADFSARFNCKERRYRYFFTNPAYVPAPTSDRTSEAWLDIEAMQQAARKLQGLHDFRNFCKMDPSKQIYNFHRRIFSASVKAVTEHQEPGAFLKRPPFVQEEQPRAGVFIPPELYYFEVRGSAFLWHQVRHMVAILFLVGQGYESPSVIEDMLDIQNTPSKPNYDMASDVPLVLWDCIFPDPAKHAPNDHSNVPSSGYTDAMNWIYVGDDVDNLSTSTRRVKGMEDRKYGRLGIMEDVWSLWRKRKMEEVLAGSLMDVVAQYGKPAYPSEPETLRSGELSARVFDGSDYPRTVGRYIPIIKRERMETAEVVNARWLERRILNGTQAAAGDADIGD